MNGKQGQRIMKIFLTDHGRTPENTPNTLNSLSPATK